MLIEFFSHYDVIAIPIGGKLIRNQPDPNAVRRGETRVYNFSRNEAGALICDVCHEGDLRWFLSIREGYAPYGDEARAEAKEKYRWRENMSPQPVEAPVAAGQPPVVLEMVDDDLDDIAGEDGDADDDDDLGLDPAVGEDDDTQRTAPLGDLPEPPPKDADGDIWMAYGRALVQNPKEHNQLEEYARTNYGVDLDKRLGTLRLLKEIAALQVKEAA